jgi:Transposase DDE domain
MSGTSIRRPKTVKKGAKLYAAMAQQQSVNIRKISRNRAEQVGNYRFLENENVTISELVSCVVHHCAKNVKGKHILAINDTSEINLQSHRGRLKPEGLGVVGNNKDVGFYIHPTLVLDADNGFPLGLSAIQLWTREMDHEDKNEREYKNLPIEKKESYKWIKSAIETKTSLSESDVKMVTHIGDRESDIFELFARLPSKNHHLLIRVAQNRRLTNKSESLYTYLSKRPCEGTYTVQIQADSRIERKAREALLLVRCAKVQIKRPDNLRVVDYPETIELYAVEAIEVNPPIGQKPVHWRLLTTHSVVCLEQALQVIEWYQWRWRIEQLFATLKTVGLDIESTQLESIQSIQRLTVLALSVAVNILQLLVGRDLPQLSADIVFCTQEQQCLSHIAPTVDGQTTLQQNPYPPRSLSWATWIIARLGGGSGYRSQRPPGIPTLIQGLIQFKSLFQGWKLALGKDLCTR